MIAEYVLEPRVAYFSMEIAIRNDIPTYGGGLGVLAGDTLRSAADLGLPMVGVTLVSRRGYFRQEIDATGRQIEHPDPWEPAERAVPLAAKVALPIAGRTVWVGGWLLAVESHMAGRQPVILLDTDLDENHPDDRTITHHLYGGDTAYRLRQELVLGIGGVRMLRALGFRIRRYHMNEGHSALLAMELLNQHAHAPEDVAPGESAYDMAAVRDLCVFTTHTPVEAGHDRFPHELVSQVAGELVDLPVLRALGGEDRLNMTRLALHLSEYVNGVAKRHAEVSRRMFPGYRVHAVTNGVHPFTWTGPEFRRLYDTYLPGWCHEPELLVRADCCLPREAIVEAHRQARERLIERVRATLGVALAADRPIIGYARRMTAYKRPDLLFGDLARLRAIAAKWPFQVVLAGKAHPRDEGGKAAIQRLHEWASVLADALPVVFLPGYDMELALTLVAGVDLWLNTPLRPLEASGTSGMKAAFNGVPQLSTLDGWWVEGCIEGVTGWAIGDDGEGGGDGDAAALYHKLEEVILPLYHTQPAAWAALMTSTIAKNAALFHSHRMMRRYATEAYGG